MTSLTQARWRARRAKLLAVIDPKGRASEGERANAARALSRMGPEPAAPVMTGVRPGTVTFSVRFSPPTSNTHPLTAADILAAQERIRQRVRKHGPLGGFPGADFAPGSSNLHPPRRPISSRPTRKTASGATEGVLRFDDEPFDLPSG